MSTAAAVILFAAVTVYAVFGGADFGAGFWDLIAGGAERGERPREVIDHSIAPVWEANHVWLIFVFVLLWTCFPEAYASIMLTLFVPLTLAALGIVLRGASFAFRKAVIRTRDQRNFGAAFAISSVLVPYCFGAVVGAIASGRVPAGGVAGDPWTSWVNPTSILGGILAVALTAYLAAFFLVFDAGRLADEDDGHLLPGPRLGRRHRRRRRGPRRDLRPPPRRDLPLRRPQDPRPAPGHPAPRSPASRALVLIARSRRTGVQRGARLAAVVAMGSLVVAWGVAQWDYLLPTTLTVADAAAPSGTMKAVFLATALAAVLIVPAFALLYTLDQKSLLPEESVPEPPPG